MHNEIYDLDKRLCFSDISSSTSIGSPGSSQSSMSSTSGQSSSNSTISNFPMMNFNNYDIGGNSLNMQYTNISHHSNPSSLFILKNDNNNINSNNNNITIMQQGVYNTTRAAYPCQLVILEQPAEKFRFRYKSEMHGTHGSLGGVRSEKNKKTFPEVELRNFNGRGIIRCSLYQTNLDKPSPHSHQLVVRKEEIDECDPHDVEVSPDKGYIARFENMGIIHTAKKYICDVLYNKKRNKLRFETGYKPLSQKEENSLRDETEREGKAMNLNQVILCFEAFEEIDKSIWKRIADPVYSNAINNRKSALTGELKICRMSSAVGSASGGEDLILLVEKVSKKNIQVRFFEIYEDDQVWEAFGDFTDADVHHQYAIVVRTPPYRNKDIDTNVNVFIELVRKSDDERSVPVSFRYKPRDVILSRKRRRTSYQSSTTSPVSSSELPEPVARSMGYPQSISIQPQQTQTISQEFNRDAQLDSLFHPGQNAYQCEFNAFVQYASNSDEWKKVFTNIDQTELFNDFESVFGGELETDGETTVDVKSFRPKHFHQSDMNSTTIFQKRMNFFNLLKEDKTKIRKLLDDYAQHDENADTIIHDIVKQGSIKEAKILFEILNQTDCKDLLSQANNFGQTPLHTACLFDQAAFIRPLLRLKCDANAQDCDGNTALHIAVSENLKDCFKSFVEFKTSSNDGNDLNVNLVNDNGLTPLHVAIRENNIDFVEALLIKCNASAKVSNSRDGNNALHLAIQLQNKKIVKCLLENSEVKMNAKNRSGHTAIDLAKSLTGQVRQDILDVLKEKMPSLNGNTSEENTEFIKEEPDEDNESSGDEDDEKPSHQGAEALDNEELLRRKLQNEQIRNRIAQPLNVGNKWQKVVSELKLDGLLFLFVNAEAMLQYIATMDEMKPFKLISALQVVDAEVANLAISLI